jgi:acetyl esterase/lipase
MTWRRTWGAALALALLASIAATQPAMAARARYRDAVFSRVAVTRDLRYGSAPGRTGAPETLKLDMYQPVGDTVARRPAIVWVHGGGFSTGDKTGLISVTLARRSAQEGFVAVSINYRLLVAQGCNGAGGVSTECYNAALAAVHDGQAAVRWLRRYAARYRIDTTRIGIGGESAGAIVAVGAGVLSSQPGTSGNPGFSSKVGAWVSISGGLPGGAFVDRHTAPGILFSGTADNTVPYSWSAQTAAAMRRAGVPVVLKTLRGAGHVPWAQYRTLFETASDAFLFRHLDLAHAAR